MTQKIGWNKVSHNKTLPKIISQLYVLLAMFQNNVHYRSMQHMTVPSDTVKYNTVCSWIHCTVEYNIHKRIAYSIWPPSCCVFMCVILAGGLLWADKTGRILNCHCELYHTSMQCTVKYYIVQIQYALCVPDQHSSNMILVPASEHPGKVNEM